MERARLGGDQMLLAFRARAAQRIPAIPRPGARVADRRRGPRGRTRQRAARSPRSIRSLRSPPRQDGSTRTRALDAADEALRTDATQRQIVSNIVKGNVAGIRFATGQVAEGLAAFAGGAPFLRRRRRTHRVHDLSRRPRRPARTHRTIAAPWTWPHSPKATPSPRSPRSVVPDLATLAEERPADVASARDRAAKLSPDDATALVFTTIDRLIAEHEA